jgi:hypothetical protein
MSTSQIGGGWPIFNHNDFEGTTPARAQSPPMLRLGHHAPTIFLSAKRPLRVVGRCPSTPGATLDWRSQNRVFRSRRERRYRC